MLGRHGEVLVQAGRPVPSAVISAVRAGKRIDVHDAAVVTEPIGAARNPDGTVVLTRDAETLDQRVRALWLALAAAATVTLGFGAVTAAGLARWIAHPLRGLGFAASRMGHGDASARTDVRTGPPEVRAVALAFNSTASLTEPASR